MTDVQAYAQIKANQQRDELLSRYSLLDRIVLSIFQEWLHDGKPVTNGDKWDAQGNTAEASNQADS
jgi:hypothetical protein